MVMKGLTIDKTILIKGVVHFFLIEKISQIFFNLLLIYVVKNDNIKFLYTAISTVATMVLGLFLSQSP